MLILYNLVIWNWDEAQDGECQILSIGIDTNIFSSYTKPNGLVSRGNQSMAFPTAAGMLNSHDVNVFAAIGDPTRFAIVEKLSRSDATVQELADPFDMTLQAVAKHVRILESAGVVSKKKIGRSQHCSLNQNSITKAQKWLTRIESDWNARLDRLGTFLEETE